MEAMLILVDHSKAVILKEQPGIDAAALDADAAQKKAKVQVELDAALAPGAGESSTKIGNPVQTKTRPTSKCQRWCL